MKELQITQLNYDDLSKKVNKFCLSNNGRGKECASYIQICQGEEILYLESDAMEPEDARFSRDLNWVSPALKHVYELGIAVGESRGRNKQ